MIPFLSPCYAKLARVRVKFHFHFYHLFAWHSNNMYHAYRHVENDIYNKFRDQVCICDVAALSHVMEAGHVPALAKVLAMVSWQSHVISNSINSPDSSRSLTSCFQSYKGTTSQHPNQLYPQTSNKHYRKSSQYHKSSIHSLCAYQSPLLHISFSLQYPYRDVKPIAMVQTIQS